MNLAPTQNGVLLVPSSFQPGFALAEESLLILWYRRGLLENISQTGEAALDRIQPCSVGLETGDTAQNVMPSPKADMGKGMEMHTSSFVLHPLELLALEANKQGHRGPHQTLPAKRSPLVTLAHGTNGEGL